MNTKKAEGITGKTLVSQTRLLSVYAFGFFINDV
ncbi:hypothetical protein SAMN05216378_0637 [Paenibacillus catalpae]|uniref:Uncharacterized protein n=1 Tax=Paenibacillus catalpae TaxID=1045775 RepID=A0A1I1TQK2_9BACL|nr:hypothetical protein SAMN05216378_0637 [Paenibacillus catalpae]